MSPELRDEVTGISLRLRHREPRDLGHLLETWKLRSGRAWRAGDPRTTPKGERLGDLWPDSYAYAELGLLGGQPLRSELNVILDQLDTLGSQLAEFVGQGGRAELFVHWHFNGNGGDTLGWELLHRFYQHRLDLALDIYPDRDWLEGVAIEPA